MAAADTDHDGLIFRNLARYRIFDGPNQVWLTAITQIAIATGFVYMAATGCLVTPADRICDQPLN